MIFGVVVFLPYRTAFFHNHRSRKKGLNFAKFHARGGRGLQRAHPEVGIPLPPPAHPRRGRGGTAGGAGCATAGVYPAAGAATGRGATYDGAARARRAATPNAAATGRTLGAATGRGRIPGRRATGANRPLSGANTAYFRAATGRGALPAARAATCAGAGRIPGRGYPGGRRGGTAYPRRGGYPAAAPPGEDHCFPAACDGFSPHQISVRVPPAATPARLPGGAAQKNIFSGHGFLCRNTGLAHIARLYRSGTSGRGYGDTH